jgi:hypothetical protein
MLIAPRLLPPRGGVQCNARTRAGTPCRRTAIPGHWRCGLHGGKSTGPRTPEGKRRTLAAMAVGRRRWAERMKSAGLPLPTGRKKRGTAPRSKIARIAQAQRSLERIMEVSKRNPLQLPAVAPAGGAPPGQSRGERLSVVSGQALDTLATVLNLPLPDPDDPHYMKMINAQIAAALGVLGLQWKVDAAQLRPASGEDPALSEIWRRIEENNQAKTIEAFPPGARPKRKVKAP